MGKAYGNKFIEIKINTSEMKQKAKQAMGQCDTSMPDLPDFFL